MKRGDLMVPKIAVALDNVDNLETLSKLVEATAPYVDIFKIGLELYTRYGPSVLNSVRNAKKEIFLDLKFHDIPNTVSKAVQSAADLEVNYLTLHTSGGLEMLKAAQEAAEKFGKSRPKLLGVTVLTSISEDTLRNQLKVNLTPADYVVNLASLAKDAKLDGIVCSASDLSFVKSTVTNNFEIVTPGIRPSGSSVHDQKRIATPKSAMEQGATVLVIGRPITESTNPANAASEIRKELNS